MNLSPLDAALTRWTFRFVLLRSAHSREALAGMAADSRFGGCQIEESGIELELRLAKPA